MASFSESVVIAHGNISTVPYSSSFGPLSKVFVVETDMERMSDTQETDRVAQDELVSSISSTTATEVTRRRRRRTKKEMEEFYRQNPSKRKFASQLQKIFPVKMAYKSSYIHNRVIRPFDQHRPLHPISLPFSFQNNVQSSEKRHFHMDSYLHKALQEEDTNFSNVSLIHSTQMSTFQFTESKNEPVEDTSDPLTGPVSHHRPSLSSLIQASFLFDSRGGAIQLENVPNYERVLEQPHHMEHGLDDSPEERERYVKKKLSNLLSSIEMHSPLSASEDDSVVLKPRKAFRGSKSTTFERKIRTFVNRDENVVRERYSNIQVAPDVSRSSFRHKGKFGLYQVCLSCKTTKTPYWRESWNPGSLLCNACGLRFSKFKRRCTQCNYVPRKEDKASHQCPACLSSWPVFN